MQTRKYKTHESESICKRSEREKVIMSKKKKQNVTHCRTTIYIAMSVANEGEQRVNPAKSVFKKKEATTHKQLSVTHK